MRKAALILAAAFLFHPQAFANPEACTARYEGRQKEILKGVRRLELYYSQYRLSEFKIRRLMYEKIWQARTDGNDPLSKEKRAQGQEEEKRLAPVLRDLRQESETASNGFLKSLQALQQADANVSPICPRSDFRTCLAQAYQPVYRLLEECRAAFDSIFEQEREYRTAVENVSGGRDGLYPQDTVEPAAGHTDFYWRFESARSPQRFEEDSHMNDLLTEIRRILTANFPGDSCCLQCI